MKIITISSIKLFCICIISFLTQLLFSCNNEIGNLKVDSGNIKDSLNLKYYNGELFTGIMVTKMKSVIDDSNFKLESEIKRGKETGTQKQYSNDRLTLSVNSKDGGNNGEVKTFFTNGNVSEEYNFQKGKKIGKHINYYENGKVKAERYYNNEGNLEGEFKEYKPNGDIFLKGEYKNGKIISYDCKSAETILETENNLLGIWKQIDTFSDGSYWQFNFYKTTIGDPEFTLMRISSSGSTIEDFNNDIGWWSINEPAKAIGKGRMARSYQITFSNCRRMSTGNFIFEKK
jgi:hypothetical protein